MEITANNLPTAEALKLKGLQLRRSKVDEHEGIVRTILADKFKLAVERNYQSIHIKPSPNDAGMSMTLDELEYLLQKILKGLGYKIKRNNGLNMEDDPYCIVEW